MQFVDKISCIILHAKLKQYVAGSGWKVYNSFDNSINYIYFFNIAYTFIIHGSRPYCNIYLQCFVLLKYLQFELLKKHEDSLNLFCNILLGTDAVSLNIKN